MSLDTMLAAELAKITNDDNSTKDQEPVTLTGTVKRIGDETYVLIDGADEGILTPFKTTTNFDLGDRVTCIIENHELIVTGNITAPSITRPDDIPDGSIRKEQMVLGSIPMILDGEGSPDPEGHHDGDVYFDSDNGNALYVFREDEEGGHWILKQFSGGAVAVDGTMVYYTDVEPEEGKPGDTWFKKQNLPTGGYDYTIYEYVEGIGWKKAELDGTCIKAKTITAGQIKAGAITADEISASYMISASKIVGGTITGCTYETVGDGVESGILTCYYPEKNNWTYETIVQPGAVYSYKRSGNKVISVVMGNGFIAARGSNTSCILNAEPKNGWIATFTGGDVEINGNIAIHTGNVGSYAAAKNHTHNYFTASPSKYTANSKFRPVGMAGDDFNPGYYMIRDDFKAWFNASSRKAKHDIKPMTDEWLDQIHKLYDAEVKVWKYNKTEDYNDDERFGLIAEDIAELIPSSAVYNSDGEIGTYEDRIVLNGLLVLVQEQKKQIDSLEERLAKLEDLEKRIAALEEAK